jgi:hypothetical protein
MTRHLTLIAHLIFATLLSAALLLSGCASKPAPPDWQANAFSALKGFSAAYLSGNSRLAELEFARAKSEISTTGRADLLARAELIRCAVRVASLEFDNCANYQVLAQDAELQERAYAVFLSGHWEGLNTALLPVQHREFVMRAAADNPAGSVNSISILVVLEDPLAQLVAAGVLLQSGRLTPADIVAATQTASNQGWRRPLLAWLGLQGRLATDAGDLDVAVRIQRRIDLVLQTPQ